MLSNLFAPLAMKVAAGIGGAMLLAIAVLWFRADSLSEQRDRAQGLYVTERAKHAVTRASLGVLADKLEGFVKEGELRAERRDKALADVREETAELRSQADKLERGEIDITEVEGL